MIVRFDSTKVANGFIALHNAATVCNWLAVMSREELLEALRDLDRREKPGSAAAQLREIEAEINARLAKGYTQKQIWTALRGRGLKLSFSGFKTCLHRMQKEVIELQKVSSRLETCPHCGVMLTDVEAGSKEGNGGVGTTTDLRPAVSTEAGTPDISASGGRMGETFARRLQTGALQRGLLSQPALPTETVTVVGVSKKPQ
ncbi:hypothetical protein [Burkholderia pyrrocinia]|uniref:hypothetical protein n=1 Tax=Burkholderia pyrrocinia TaxID=60550 RepID=UPI0015886A99|nr:hypothetical protein [Burkholderia pyrrocinia]